MKIVKSRKGVRQVFDTDSPEKVFDWVYPTAELTPLHQWLHSTYGGFNAPNEHNFLTREFGTDHPIMLSFTESYYYFLP